MDSDAEGFDEDEDTDTDFDESDGHEEAGDDLEDKDQNHAMNLIDPAVAESDARMIDEAVKEIAEEGRLPSLVDEDIKLGQYSVAKVSSSYPP